LEIRSWFLPRPAWTMILLFYASCHCWNDKNMPPHSTFILWDGGLPNFFALAVLNHDPPHLSIPNRLGWQVHATRPSYWLRWRSC
jgi:hypothetical protein